MNPWQRAALALLATSAFMLGRAKADCAIQLYSVPLELAATTPPDDSWPATLRMTQSDDHTITWVTVGGETAPVDLRAAQ